MDVRRIVSLGPAEIQQALDRAKARYARHQNPSYAHYPNAPVGHLRGALGELAVKKWLEGLGCPFEAPGLKKDSPPDFLIRGPQGQLGIEVKTWSSAHWERLGRCISPKQYELFLQNDVDIVLWAILDEIDEEGQGFLGRNDQPWDQIEEKLKEEIDQGLEVILAGWVWLVEVEEWGEPRPTGYPGRETLNYQAPTEGQPMGRLERLLQRYCIKKVDSRE